MSKRTIKIYDTTLRDGAQTRGVDFSVLDKQALSLAMDELGFAYIEGGWPGANPTDEGFFADIPSLHHSQMVAFGMTRRPGRSAANDTGLQAILRAEVGAVCLVGKSWDFQVTEALNISLEENIALIADSVAEGKIQGKEVLFDAEHFFDGYKANPVYALSCLEAAAQAGATWLVLCDTNGGTLPHEITHIISEILAAHPSYRLGIHAHDDTGHAVANSLAAILAGADLVQGTINGLGERCGNANLISLIPTLALKMGFDVGMTRPQLQKLGQLSRLLDERLNRAPNRQAPYIGEFAFAHKGGLHASAILKNPACYEHIEPELVGNRRHLPISDQAGRASLMAQLRDLGLELASDDARLAKLLQKIKELEFQGYSFDGAEASFALLAYKMLDRVPVFFRPLSFRVSDERRWLDNGEVFTLSEATTKIEVKGERVMTVAEGNGPVNALDAALRQALLPVYPLLQQLSLTDYKVRILTPEEGTRAVTRVMIETMGAHGERWNTVGVSGDIIEASFHALLDSVNWCLLREMEKNNV
ncbi:MAG: citramalate synthase [Alphaproteobacteria bacterium]